MISLPVKDSYRYCIGCDQAVLEINIQQHEQECHIFRAMSTLNAEELNHELEEKLQRLSNRIDKGRMEVAQLEEMTLCCSRIL